MGGSYSVPLCPEHVLFARSLGLSREAKKAALEDSFRDILDQLRESKELIRQSALLQHAQHFSENETEPIAVTRQPDFYFEDWNGREYLADLKNVFYYPLKPVESLDSILFYKQTPAWVEQNVLNKRWDAPKYVPREYTWVTLEKGKHNVRWHSVINIRDPAKITKVYVSTIPSFTPGAWLKLGEFEKVFTLHPILPGNPISSEFPSCGRRAFLSLYEQVRDLVERKVE